VISSAEETIIDSLDMDIVSEIMIPTGYRVEPEGDRKDQAFLRPAAGRPAYRISLGGRRPGTESKFADATLSASFLVQGDLPLGTVNQWNSAKRFACLHLEKDVLTLGMDISVQGGVTAWHLLAQIEAWEELLQELIAYLRTETAELNAARGAGEIRVLAELDNKRSAAVGGDPALPLADG